MNRDQLRSNFGSNIKPGEIPANAENFLTSLGFTCSNRRNALFIECDTYRKITEYRPADYLYGDRKKRAVPFSFVSVRRQVTVIIKNGAVTDIVLVSEGYTGP
jgi:hypothetical protein